MPGIELNNLNCLKVNFSNESNAGRSANAGMKHPENLNSISSDAINDQVRFQYYISVHLAFGNKKSAFRVYIICNIKIID